MLGYGDFLRPGEAIQRTVQVAMSVATLLTGSNQEASSARTSLLNQKFQDQGIVIYLKSSSLADPGSTPKVRRPRFVGRQAVDLGMVPLVDMSTKQDTTKLQSARHLSHIHHTI